MVPHDCKSDLPLVILTRLQTYTVARNEDHEGHDEIDYCTYGTSHKDNDVFEQ